MLVDVCIFVMLLMMLYTVGYGVSRLDEERDGTDVLIYMTGCIASVCLSFICCAACIVFSFSPVMCVLCASCLGISMVYCYKTYCDDRLLN